MSYIRAEVNYEKGGVDHQTGMSRQEVEDYAARVANLVGYAIGGKLSEVVSRYGGRLHCPSGPNWLLENGSIYVHGRNDFDIVISGVTTRTRNRFTIGHELGHYFLHSRQGVQPLIAYRSGSTRIEWEANWFSAALLMPANAFKEACNEGVDLPKIASRFDVSIDAAIVRAKVLGITRF